MKCLFCTLLFIAIVLAQAAQQQAIKPIPPAGIEVPAQERAELEAGLQRFRVAIEKLRDNPLLPDVLIYHEAVRYALQYNEFFKPDEIAKARTLLLHGEQRARELADGKAPWTTATGLIVRGYVSKIDKRVKTYGI